MKRRWITATLLLALALRLGFAMPMRTDLASLRALPDQLEYLSLSQNLLAGHGLTMRDERLPADVRAFRTPGYPLLIAACGGSVAAVRIAQALIDTSTALAVYLLARRWLNERRAIASAAVIAINPFLIYFSALVLSETLFIALMTWGMTLLIRAPRKWRWTGLALLAFSVLVRPGAIALPAVLAFAAHRSWRELLLAIGMTFTVLLPWAIRNYNVVGAFVFTSTNSGYTLYDGFNPAATGASDQRFVVEQADVLRKMSEVERSRYLSREAFRYIADHPGRAMWLTFKKIARTWSPIPLSGENRGAARIVIALIYSIPLFAYTIFGLLRPTLSRAVKVFLLIPAIYFTAAHAVSVGSLRYRLPADVPMSVIAVVGFAVVSDRWSVVRKNAS